MTTDGFYNDKNRNVNPNIFIVFNSSFLSYLKRYYQNNLNEEQNL